MPPPLSAGERIEAQVADYLPGVSQTWWQSHREVLPSWTCMSVAGSVMEMGSGGC